MRQQIIQNDDSQVEKNLIKRLLHACVREQLLSYTIKDNLLLISLTQSQQTLLAENVRQFNLGKLKIQGEIILVSHNQFTILKSVRQFLNLIHHEIRHHVSREEWEQFVKEIDNCTFNEGLVKKFMNTLNERLANDIVKSKSESLLDYVNTHFTTKDQLIFFETWAANGHPYHPCHKTKLGFSPKAYAKFSPEFNQDIEVPMAAIQKTLMQIENHQDDFDYTSWFIQQFPEEWEKWKTRLNENDVSPNDYYPIFVHPWQYENVLTKLFHHLIDQKQLILFKDIYVVTKASLSFRTMIIKESDTKPHIKLPVAVRSTSAMRTIKPSSVHNGPRLGNILKQILATENNIAKYLKLADEICGLHVKSTVLDLANHLAVIYRRNPATLVNSNQLAIVVAALFEKSPLTQCPLYIEILQKAVGKGLDEAKAYFDGYCRTVIQAYLDLFLIYGIALEGHQQNAITVFENHRPAFMIARDLCGLRIHAESLKAKGYDFSAHPDSTTISNERQDATNKILHAVIQYHLGELALLLAEHYQTAESDFWFIIKNNIEKRFHEIKDKVDKERWQQEYDAIFVDDWQIKGLMRMRLHDHVSHKHIYIHLKNPLRDLNPSS